MQSSLKGAETGAYGSQVSGGGGDGRILILVAAILAFRQVVCWLIWGSGVRTVLVISS